MNLFALTMASSLSALGLAQTPDRPVSPRQSSPALSVPAKIVQKFADNRRARKPPVSFSPEWVFDEEGGELRAKGRLVAYEDAVFTLAVDVSPEVRALLIGAGVEVVSARDQLRDNTIFDGRYYRVLHSATPPEGMSDTDEWLVGRNVELTLRRTKAGRHLVVDARPARDP